MSAPSTRTMLVIHEPGDPNGGAAWRSGAVAEKLAGWTIHAPDLPGHGTSALPVGGNYDPTSPGFDALRAILHEQITPDVIVGVGGSGWAAQTLLLGGHGERLVMIDGLGDPWSTPQEAVSARRERLRALAKDPAAMAGWAPSGQHRKTDPRLAHNASRHGSHELAMRAAKATACPVLIVHTNAHDDASQQVVAEFARARVEASPTTHPDNVVGLIAEWLDA